MNSNQLKTVDNFQRLNQFDIAKSFFTNSQNNKDLQTTLTNYDYRENNNSQFNSIF